MKKHYSPILEFIIIGIVGALWHFIYDWSGENTFIGWIAPINESTWEHFKILFYPTLIYTVIEYFIIESKPKNYITASTIGLFMGMAAIVAFFYTYTGILGYDISVLNVFSYYVGLFVMLLVKSKILKNKSFSSDKSKYISLAFIGIFILLFGIWTANPPLLGIFENPN